MKKIFTWKIPRLDVVYADLWNHTLQFLSRPFQLIMQVEGD